MKGFKRITSMTLIWLLIYGTVVTSIIMASPKPTIYVDPPSIIDPSLIVDDTFTINVTLRDVVPADDLVGVEFKLYWDPSVLEGVSMVLPADHIFQGAADDYNMWVIKKTIDNPGGFAWYLVTCSDLTQGYTGGYLPISDGIAATITLKVKALGESSLELSVSKLADQYGGAVSHDKEHGYFRNTEEAPPPPSALLYVDPPSIVNMSLVPPSSFYVNVSIINATDLYSFEFKLSYDPTILNAEAVTLGDFFPGGSTLIDPPWINNTEGHVHFGATLPPSEPLKTGDGTLAEILFNVTGLGSTVLELLETELLDGESEALPHSTSNGYFNNAVLAKLYVDPPELIDPELMPPATFEININIFNVENMYEYEFNLTFDRNILTCLYAFTHDVLDETNYEPEYIISNTQGFVWVSVAYYPPAEPITSYENITLVTIKFRVKGMGCTVLDLHDTHLTDHLDQAIPQDEPGDGFFCAMIRDVAITDVVPEVAAAYQGWIIQINVTAENKGNLTETFDVKAYYESELIGTLTVTDLLPNDAITITFYWDTVDATACNNYTISAEALPVPYEMNLGDNIFIDGTVKIKLMGDITGDGIVNIFDAVELADAAGTTPEHPRWDAQADLNRDGKVDLFDAVLLSMNAGKSC